MEKAYKLLAQALKVSHNEAKALIDRGLVSVGNERLRLARTLLKENTKFKVQKPDTASVLLRNNEMIAINKPPFLNAEEIAMAYPGYELINRLDRETSGVMLLGTKEFKDRAIEEFRQKKSV